MKKALLIFSVLFLSLVGINKLDAYETTNLSFKYGSTNIADIRSFYIDSGGPKQFDLQLSAFNILDGEALQSYSKIYLKIAICTSSDFQDYSNVKGVYNFYRQKTPFVCDIYGRGDIGHVNFLYLSLTAGNKHSYIFNGSIILDTNAPYYMSFMYYQFSNVAFQYDNVTDTTLLEEINQNLKNYQQNQSEFSNKLDDLNNTQQETNNKLDDLNKNLTDTTSPDTSEFEDVAGWLPPGPVDSILTLPLNVLNSISSALNGKCTSIQAPLPFIEKKLEIMCGTEFYSSVSGLSLFLNTLFTILGGVTLYKYFVYLYNWIDNIVSLKERDEKWGAV